MGFAEYILCICTKGASMIYALIRVSTRDQNEERQLAEMKKLGISNENIFIEKASGKTINRIKYKALKNKLKKGDILYIHTVDRLGRHYNEMINEWFHYWRNGDYSLRFINYPILNTDRECITLLDTFIRDIFFLILAFVAEQEYRNIKERSEQGILLAKEKGVKFGRPKKRITKNQVKIIQLWDSGELSIGEAMQKLKLKKSAFYSLASEVLERTDT